MKDAKTFAGICRAGRTISRILFVLFVLIGAFTAIGFTGLFWFDGMNGTALYAGLAAFLDMDLCSVTAAMLISTFSCAAEALLCRLSWKLFRFLVAEGTPFTGEGLRKIRNFGILALVLPPALMGIDALAYALLEGPLGSVERLSGDFWLNMIVGAVFLAFSLWGEKNT